MHSPIAIRRARSEDLPAAAELLAHTLRFSARDALPAWFMRTTDECGGLTLVATTGRVLVGVSYAVRARGYLFSCGLAVAPAVRGRRLGLELKLAQRREAIALGYTTIRWTTDPINGRALRVYLSGLGALIAGYRPGLHDGLRADPGHPQDDLELVWHLSGAPDRRGDDVARVELPWSSSGADELQHRRRVREQMSALLADGYVGSGVEIDREAQRCHVTFTHAAT